MHLTRRAPRAMAVATRWNDGSEIAHYNPRTEATRLLREKIAEKRAGLDPFDPHTFVLLASEHEQVWAYLALELCGVVLSRAETADGGQRIRAVLESDVRSELGLDGETPAVIGDLVTVIRHMDAPTALMDAVFGVLPEARPVLFSVPLEAGDEPAYLPALREARAAYDRRNTNETEEAS